MEIKITLKCPSCFGTNIVKKLIITDFVEITIYLFTVNYIANILFEIIKLRINSLKIRYNQQNYTILCLFPKVYVIILFKSPPILVSIEL